jgi:hypothetical protein
MIFGFDFTDAPVSRVRRFPHPPVAYGKLLTHPIARQVPQKDERITLSATAGGPHMDPSGPPLDLTRDPDETGGVRIAARHMIPPAADDIQPDAQSAHCLILEVDADQQVADGGRKFVVCRKALRNAGAGQAFRSLQTPRSTSATSTAVLRAMTKPP